MLPLYVGSMNSRWPILMYCPFKPYLFSPKSFCLPPCPFREEYMQYFEQRDLEVFSVEPLLLFPTHYTGEPGYISDTETSTIWDDETVDTDWDREGARRRSEKETGGVEFPPVAPRSAHGGAPLLSASGNRDELWGRLLSCLYGVLNILEGHWLAAGTWLNCISLLLCGVNKNCICLIKLHNMWKTTF